MFKLFNKKSEVDQLYDRHKKLLKNAHQLSTTDRKASDLKHAEADTILKKIEQLELR